MKRTPLIICAAVASFLVALGITLYPLISNAYNKAHQSQIHTSYQDQLQQADNTAILEAKELAVAYNNALKPGVQPADSFSQDAILWASEDYESQLDITGSGIMGYVIIPSIQIDLPIYHGTSDTSLNRGAGHLLGSSLPVGGESTHSVITAHSGVASQKLFSDLDKLTLDDVFYLDVLGERLAYQVDQVKVVLPHDTTYLGITAGADHATLITCTPFGINTHRLLVRGKRIPYEAPEAELEIIPEETHTADSTWEQEYLKGIYIAVCIVVIVILIALLIWGVRRLADGKIS